MRVALVSDIHGNLEALESVLTDIAAASVDEIISLGDNGILLVKSEVDKKTKQLKSKPEIITRGFMLPDEFEAIADSLQSRIQSTISSANGNLENAIMRELKGYLLQETKRNPYIYVIVNES